MATVESKPLKPGYYWFFINLEWVMLQLKDDQFIFSDGSHVPKSATDDCVYIESILTNDKCVEAMDSLHNGIKSIADKILKGEL